MTDNMPGTTFLKCAWTKIHPQLKGLRSGFLRFSVYCDKTQQCTPRADELKVLIGHMKRA